MNRTWDTLNLGIELEESEIAASAEYAHQMQAWHEGWLREAYRILVPGGIIKSFAATRTLHRMGKAMKNVGFEDLKMINWNYSTGFPKGLNISKAIQAYQETGKSDSTQTGDGSRDRDGLHWSEFPGSNRKAQSDPKWKPTTPEAIEFTGYGTSLKPSFEPAICGRKPLV